MVESIERDDAPPPPIVRAERTSTGDWHFHIEGPQVREPADECYRVELVPGGESA